MYLGPTQIAAACKRAVEGPAGTTVLLRWQTVAGGSLDATTGAMVGGQVIEHSGTVRAFMHAINPASTSLRYFEEIEAGDMMLDFPPEVVLDGRQGLRFEVGGEVYVQRNLGGKAAKHFDVRAGVNATPTFRSIIARKAT